MVQLLKMDKIGIMQVRATRAGTFPLFFAFQEVGFSLSKRWVFRFPRGGFAYTNWSGDSLQSLAGRRHRTNTDGRFRDFLNIYQVKRRYFKNCRVARMTLPENHYGRSPP
jgi:hypothetical protein